MYSFVHEGITYQVCILDTYNDYVRLTYKDENCVYYITKWRVFVLKGYVFAKGNLRNAWQVDPVHILDYASSILPKAEPYKPQASIAEVKSMEFKTADTKETVLELNVPTAIELSVPTIDELDKYFSSIGLKYFEEIFKR